MRLEKYPSKANKKLTTFKFISEGQNGQIFKIVLYTKVEGIKNLYNLALGDINPISGAIDDLVVSNNQDRDKVLATVAHTILVFTERYPKAYVYFKGSTETRNRLYQIAISKYFDELFEIFDIQGRLNKKWFPYEKNINYSAFLISRKITKL